MSTSNSTNYTLTAEELIRSSLEPLGVAMGGEPLEPEDEQTCLRVLNPMLKALQKKLNIWKRKTASITLVAGQYIYTIGQKSKGNATGLPGTVVLYAVLIDSSANFDKDDVQAGDAVKNLTSGQSATVISLSDTSTVYIDADIFTLGTESYEITSANVSAPRPIAILECNRKDTTGAEVPVTQMTRNEYEALSNKTSAGSPLNYHYEPTIENGTLWIWQAPDATAVSTYTLELVYQAPIEDVDHLTETIDLPAENLEAIQMRLTYLLSSRFGGKSSTDKQLLRADAKEAIDLAEGYNQEDGSILFQPEIRDY